MKRRFALLGVVAVSLVGMAGVVTSGAASARAVGWQPPKHIGGNFNDVSCASATFCAAVTTNGGVRMFDGHTWSAQQSIAPADNLHVSCPTSSFCVAIVGNAGQAVMYQDGAWGAPIQIDQTDKLLIAVSCSSASFCVAGDFYGNAFYFDGSTWTSGAGPEGSPASFSCTSATFCMGLDEGGIASAYDGSTWTGGVNTRLGNGVAVSCVSSLFCGAAGPRHKLNVYDDKGWGKPVKVLGGHHGGLTGLSCASAEFCVAVDWYGRSYIYDGQGWTLVWMRTKSFHYWTEVSCPSVRFCAAVDSSGWVSIYL